MKRRLAILLLMLLNASVASAATAPGRVEFQVFHNGAPLGTHTIEVREAAGALTAISHARLQAKAGPFTVFRYQQDCTETWRAQRLESLQCVTLKSGRRVNVAMRREANGLRVSTGDTSTLFPGDAQPTSWWSRNVLTGGGLIDTQNGQAGPPRVERVGDETQQIGGATVPVTHYRIYGTTAIDLWYDAAGHWVGCAFTARGQHIEYRLITSPTDAPA